ncbi:MAG: bifunctional pyr operon transcriptional regulator/uracil phosphoribosyltransferase PyrR [Methyloversatilis discipulorum]|jgi:pyrimidine operon attenuation protein/uracil phosphoribosyltransferase|uniref:bifunctional pyr operon transcriptional regulator/uracil phosphoribosyltransferase PyrR n=1 Tax=Methyloversatilis discipulorum TaxID=1119528 RepID=UPI0026F30FC2|nr:bifunctional pyr operon transcriptional regulator/uracil phosphoribosyltransferase PyrR [Methyloversatilis discipulorum]MBV5287608.1 bifunctional pyr operon transcriptional regulator/uracil phosphoribosyltransferase PyrR [Methyloversatilis discipulorum]
MSLPDAEKLLADLAAQMRPQVTPDTALVGLHTGGVWLAQRLHALLGLTQPAGSLDVSFYRDDYAQRGLSRDTRSSALPFDVEGRHLILVDDVLHTGRTIRAALNELFDYGRPAKVELAVLIDRGGRQLPVAPTYCATRLDLAEGTRVKLAQDGERLALRLLQEQE